MEFLAFLGTGGTGMDTSGSCSSGVLFSGTALSKVREREDKHMVGERKNEVWERNEPLTRFTKVNRVHVSHPDINKCT